MRRNFNSVPHTFTDSIVFPAYSLASIILTAKKHPTALHHRRTVGCLNIIFSKALFFTPPQNTANQANVFSYQFQESVRKGSRGSPASLKTLASGYVLQA